jgi:hypothetical protein
MTSIKPLHAEYMKKGLNIFLDVLGFVQKLMSLNERHNVAFACNIGDTEASWPFPWKTKGAIEPK